VSRDREREEGYEEEEEINYRSRVGEERKRERKTESALKFKER
jgi:hypothetical protein